MNELFLKIVNMSISASWLVLAVLLIRLVLKKSPKWVNVLLWGIVAVRLLCPFSVESIFSMIPSAETIPVNIEMDTTPVINSGINAINDVVNPIISQSNTAVNGASVNPLQICVAILANIWIMGIAVLLIYTAVSCYRLHRKVDTAVILKDNIFQSENVGSPFVFGIIRPRIYLPFKIDGKDLEHVIAHEQAHICRKDHWWKPVGFLILMIHWFNPLMWLAYVLLCRDIELACDERVIKELDNEQRADYTQALVACSVARRLIAACPLAFGEVGVRDRVKSVMNYKKPAFWIINISVFTCVFVAICFLTDPIPDREFPMNWKNIADLAVTDILENIADIENLDDTSLLSTDELGFDLTLTSDFELYGDGTVSFFYVEGQKTNSAQLRLYPNDQRCYVTNTSEFDNESNIQVQAFKLQHYLEAIKYLPQEEIRKRFPDADMYLLSLVDYSELHDFANGITYSSEGIMDLDDWYIHLTLLPLFKNDGEGWHGDKMFTHLYYGYEDGVQLSAEQISDKFYLTIGVEGVTNIEIKTPNTSGGCTNADGSPFKKGERIWLECLDGVSDLRGVTITAMNENGEIIWSASIPDDAENSDFVRLRQDGWEISNIE